MVLSYVRINELAHCVTLNGKVFTGKKAIGGSLKLPMRLVGTKWNGMELDKFEY